MQRDCTIYYGKRILIRNAKYCDTLFSRMKGLMFSLPLKKETGIILVAKEESILETSIHMFFVFYPIDIIWLNKKKQVIDKKSSVFPFTPILRPKEPAKYVLELPQGTAANVLLGATLDF